MVHDSFGRTDPSSSKPVYYSSAHHLRVSMTYSIPKLGGQDLYLSVVHKKGGTYQTING
jgi:hypothetical protein